MSEAKTLLEMSGADLTPARLKDACLLIIDMQNEYLDGPLELPDAARAVAHARTLLAKAREGGTPVVHVAHKGRPGGLFDRAAKRGKIVAELAPVEGETVIEKGLPNAFAGTSLARALEARGRKELIVVGFMSHMCVSSTARAAVDQGYRVTIDSSCCASRALPDGEGGTVDAATVHRVAMVELADRFAVITRDPDALK